MAGGLLEEAGPMLDRPAFRVIGAEIEPPDARKGDRSRAHGAGLERDIEIAIIEPGHPAQDRAGANDQHLRMGGRVVLRLDPVAGCRQHRAGRGIDEHGADRHLACRGGALGLEERRFHR